MNLKLNELIKIAQGGRSQNAYARHCNIDSGTITKIIKDGQKPTPEILKKMASKAQNNITYNDLMKAAGYLEEDDHSPQKQKEPPLSEKAQIMYDGLKKIGLDPDTMTDEDYEKILSFIDINKGFILNRSIAIANNERIGE